MKKPQPRSKPKLPNLSNLKGIIHRRHLSADDLSVFSSALRPCLATVQLGAKPLAFLLFLCGLASVPLLSPNSAYAENASITLTVPKTLSVQVEPGKGMKSATGKVSVKSDAEYGYTLGIKAKESGGELKTTDNKTISSITTNTTSIPASGWGWRYGEWSGTTGDPNNKAFSASPTATATPIADLTASTGGANKDYYLTIGANVDLNQPQGIYTKDFIITATAKPKNFTITYNTNGGTAVTQGSGSTYTKKATFTTAAPPTRNGYDFLGWCSVATTSGTCPSSDTTYKDSTSYTVTLPSNGNIQLWAMWQNKAISSIAQVTSMQHYGRLTNGEQTKIRASMDQNTQYELQDERDGRLYYIAKLADGNIWMTENLDLDLSTGKELSPNDTDISANWTPERSTITVATGWANDNYRPYSYDPGDRCWNGTFKSDSSLSTTNTYVTKSCSKHDAGHYYIGNYYNWSAAVAMNNTSSYTTSGQDLNQSICPRGWRLPTYQGDKSFANLNTAAAYRAGPSGTIHQPPYYFNYSGQYYSNSSTGVGQVGWFYSSVVRSANNASYMYFDYGQGLSPNTDSSRTRGYGFTLRCVARNDGPSSADDSGSSEDTEFSGGINEITTMQAYGRLSDTDKSTIKSSMTTNQQYELKDERDNRVYYVAKLADGNIWMTENLDLDLDTGKTLTTDNTDIPANWTPARSTLTTTNGWTNDNATPYSYDPGGYCWKGVAYVQGSTIANTTLIRTCTQHDSSHYYFGNYYNWSAAVALNSSSSKTSGDVDQSICPKGWRLPTYSGDKSFSNLATKTGFTGGDPGSVNLSPYYFGRSGYFSGRISEPGNDGGWWESQPSSSTEAYNFYFYFTGNPTPQRSQGRHMGMSVRCVAR